MALPSLLRFFLLSTFAIFLASPASVAEEKARAGDAKEAQRDPASESIDEKKLGMAWTPQEDTEYQEKAMKSMVEYLNQFKTAKELFADFKQYIKKSDHKAIDEFVGTKHLNSSIKFSYENKEVRIRESGGKVIAFRIESFANQIFVLEGKQVHLGHDISFAEKLETIAKTVESKFLSSSSLNLVFPEANAMATSLGGWALRLGAGATLAAAAYVGINTGWESYKGEYLERNQRVLALAEATCEKFLDHDVKEVRKTYRVKTPTWRHRRKTYEYSEYEVAKTVEVSPAERMKNEMKELRIKMGNRPDEANTDAANVVALKAWDEAAKQIQDRYKGAMLFRGKQGVKEDTFGWTRALRRRLCKGKMSWFQGYSVSDMNVDLEGDNEEDADDVLSFNSLCKKAKSLHTCLEELDRKPRLSEAGNNSLLKIMQTAKIGSEYLEREGVRRPRKTRTDTVD